MEVDSKSISKIYLASKSPRRSELLALMGVDFEVLPLDIPEIVAPGESSLDYSIRVCREKAQAAWEYLCHENLPLLPLLTADTEVVLDDNVLGKAEDAAAACEMLQRLSGRRHLVLTSITLRYREWERTLTSHSWVYFDEITSAEIEHYVASGNYMGKSGSYGIQSYAGQFIQKIEGDFYAIMGLPVNLVRRLLNELRDASH